MDSNEIMFASLLWSVRVIQIHEFMNWIKTNIEYSAEMYKTSKSCHACKLYINKAFFPESRFSYSSLKGIFRIVTHQRYITITSALDITILFIQWDANKWPGILEFSSCLHTAPISLINRMNSHRGSMPLPRGRMVGLSDWKGQKSSTTNWRGIDRRDF